MQESEEMQICSEPLIYYNDRKDVNLVSLERIRNTSDGESDKTITCLDKPNQSRMFVHSPPVDPYYSDAYSQHYSVTCLVCGDHASGRYYGVNSCNGCRGFFRRTVLNKTNYQCKYKERCFVTMDERTRCRKCRFLKCIKVGMRPEDVTLGRKEAGLNAHARVSTLTGVDNGTLISSTKRMNLTSLLEAHYAWQTTMKQSFILNPMSVDSNLIISNWSLFAETVHAAMQAGFMAAAEWAKRVPGFRDLDMEDQVALLRSAGHKCIILSTAYDSAKSREAPDTLQIASGTVSMDRKISDVFDNKVLFSSSTEGEEPSSLVLPRIFEKLVGPLSQLAIGDEELACVKALLLFDPNAKGLSDTKKVRQLRKEVETMMTHEQRDNATLTHGVMDLLLLLPSIQNLSESSKKNITSTRFFEGMKLAKIVQELLFYDDKQ